jgi:MFS family permease
VALDQTIVATALPKLASQFDALDELTWVVAGYFLTQAGLMLFLGQVLTITSSKWVYGICFFFAPEPNSHSPGISLA